MFKRGCLRLKRPIAAATLAFLTVLGSAEAGQKPPAGSPPFDEPAKARAVRAAVSLIKDHYLFPEVAQKIETEMNRRLNRGDYRRLSDPDKFARTVSRDLYLISDDKHFRVSPRNSKQAARPAENPTLAYLRSQADSALSNFGLPKAEILSGNIGYLEIKRFFGPDLASQAIVGAMKFLAAADALIIDLRQCGGGNAETVCWLCSYFFDRSVHLDSVIWPRENRRVDNWTMSEVDGQQLPDVPLFILTGRSTFSAAEAMAYDLQALKRATVVGERTPGGGHVVRTYPVDDKFEIKIPVGYALNPITKTSWEGTGLVPDLSAAAQKALEAALVKARPAAEGFRRAKEEALAQKLAEALKDLRDVERLFDSNDDETARIRLKAALVRASSFGVNEELINSAGYDCLKGKKTKLALALFQFNVDRHPFSANAWDSLAEAYFVKGDYEKSKTHYLRALEMNPHNSGAEEKLREIARRMNRIS